MEIQELTRGAGILLAISSLPSAYGIGTIGVEAKRFVDLLVDLKQKYWQVLPIGPTSFGDSPYQPLSSCAGNTYLIDLDELVNDGLLTTDEIRSFNWGIDETDIDYAILYENRIKIIQKAFQRFDTNAQDFNSFRNENKEWLSEFALFMSLKTENLNKSWRSWPIELRDRQPVALEKMKAVLYNNICFWEFCQYEFFKQWKELREYANLRGIQIIGDTKTNICLK